MEPLDVLAIVAHPDDAELLCGGTLLACKAKGERTGILDLTRGEMGTRGTPEIRAREAARASEILNLDTRANAGLPDAHVANTDETRRIVAGWLRRLRPRSVITHWIRGRHPDHTATASLVYEAAYLAGLNNYSAEGDAPAFRPLKVVHALSFREEPQKPTFVVDISDHMDGKLKAIAAYASQFGDAVQAGEVYPGGGRALAAQVRTHAARTGSLIRREYGEPFWTRETMEVSSIGSLGVSTF
jgi:bacillithiol biosynthesis deacetylase BshB1